MSVGELQYLGESLSFDDVTLMPQYSDIESRGVVDTSINLAGIELKTPIISSPMDSVTEWQMAEAMRYTGGIGIIHRYMSNKDQLEHVSEAGRLRVGAAVGIRGKSSERLGHILDLLNAGASMICVDVAHGYHRDAALAISEIKEEFPQLPVMAGNVANEEGYWFLVDAGADIVRVGIGGGSMCTTRVVTGHGLPTLESLLRIQESAPYQSSSNLDVPYVADGGIRSAGDIVKSLAAGASAVLLGRLLATTSKSPAPLRDGYKYVRGMASDEAQRDWRGYTSVNEGTSSRLPYTGNTEDVVYELTSQIRSGLSYSGARSIHEFRDRAEFERITRGGYVEGTPHGS